MLDFLALRGRANKIAMPLPAFGQAILRVWAASELKNIDWNDRLGRVHLGGDTWQRAGRGYLNTTMRTLKSVPRIEFPYAAPKITMQTEDSLGRH